MRSAKAVLHRLDLAEARAVALEPRKTPAEERPDEFGSQLLTDDPRTQAQDVHVVILHALPCGKRVVTHARADAAHLVRGDSGADAAPTQHDSAISAPVDDRGRNGRRPIGIVVARLHGRGTAVYRLVARARDFREDALPEGPSGMVGREGHSHCARTVAMDGPITCAHTSRDTSPVSVRPLASSRIFLVSTPSTE